MRCTAYADDSKEDFMSQTNTMRKQTEKLALTALLSALTAVLAYFGGFIKIGGLASINLTLIPVVLGAALLGPMAGAWLGGVSGVIFFTTADSVFWLSLSIPGTILTVMVKGILAGLLAGLVYKALEKINKYLAVIISAFICPVVNTGIFLLGCLAFFMEPVNTGAVEQGMSVGAYLIVFYVGLNFVFELLANMILSPAIVRLLSIRTKKKV